MSHEKYRVEYQVVLKANYILERFFKHYHKTTDNKFKYSGSENIWELESDSFDISLLIDSSVGSLSFARFVVSLKTECLENPECLLSSCDEAQCLIELILKHVKLKNKKVKNLLDELSAHVSHLAYKEIHRVENYMRHFIYHFLIKLYGDNWDGKSIRNIWSPPRELRVKEEPNILYKLYFEELLQILTTPIAYKANNDLALLLEDKKFISKLELQPFLQESFIDRFFSEIPDIKSLSDHWSDLQQYRNKIAHNRQLKYTEFNDIEQLVNKALSIIKLAHEHLPQIFISTEFSRQLQNTSIFSCTAEELERLKEEAFDKYDNASLYDYCRCLHNVNRSTQAIHSLKRVLLEEGGDRTTKDQSYRNCQLLFIKLLLNTTLDEEKVEAYEYIKAYLYNVTDGENDDFIGEFYYLYGEILEALNSDTPEIFDEEERTAENYFQMSAEKNNVDSIMKLVGIYHKQGNYEDAVKYLHRGVEYKVSRAYALLGSYYQNGYDVKKDTSKAIKYYKLALEEGDNSVLSNLGICMISEKNDQAITYLSKAVKEKQFMGALALAEFKAKKMEENPDNEYKVISDQDDDFIEINNYFDKALDCSSTGRERKKVLLAKANFLSNIEMYDKSSELVTELARPQGYVPAIFELGRMYYEGEGTKKEPYKAIELLKGIKDVNDDARSFYLEYIKSLQVANNLSIGRGN